MLEIVTRGNYFDSEKLPIRRTYIDQLDGSRWDSLRCSLVQDQRPRFSTCGGCCLLENREFISFSGFRGQGNQKTRSIYWSFRCVTIK